MTDAQVQAARGIIAEGQRLGHIAANFNVRGHREVKATACPGKNAFARIHEIRTPGQTNGGGTDPNAFPWGQTKSSKRGCRDQMSAVYRRGSVLTAMVSIG